MVRMDVQLLRSAMVPEGHEAFIIAYNLSILSFGMSKLEMQNSLRAAVSEIISDLANEILKAQGN